MTVATPTLVTGQLAELDRNLGGPAVMQTFLSAFVRMLQPRLDRIRRALENRDPELGIDAALSLETSAAQAQAAALAEAATDLRMRLQTCQDSEDGWPAPDEVAETMSSLNELVLRTADCVDDYLSASQAGGS